MTSSYFLTKRKLIDYHSLTNVKSSKITAIDHLSFPSREALSNGSPNILGLHLLNPPSIFLALLRVLISMTTHQGIRTHWASCNLAQVIVVLDGKRSLQVLRADEGKDNHVSVNGAHEDTDDTAVLSTVSMNHLQGSVGQHTSYLDA